MKREEINYSKLTKSELIAKLKAAHEEILTLEGIVSKYEDTNLVIERMNEMYHNSFKTINAFEDCCYKVINNNELQDEIIRLKDENNDLRYNDTEIKKRDAEIARLKDVIVKLTVGKLS